MVTKRISHVVETFGLLPTSYFGARKKRSAEQVLLLLQEHIYNTYRLKKVLSLVSFDVKGVYNKMYKDSLLKRLIVRGILMRWIDAFCLERTETILVNSYTS